MLSAATSHNWSWFRLHSSSAWDKPATIFSTAIFLISRARDFGNLAWIEPLKGSILVEAHGLRHCLSTNARPHGANKIKWKLPQRSHWQRRQVNSSSCGGCCQLVLHFSLADKPTHVFIVSFSILSLTAVDITSKNNLLYRCVSAAAFTYWVKHTSCEHSLSANASRSRICVNLTPW